MFDNFERIVRIGFKDFLGSYLGLFIWTQNIVASWKLKAQMKPTQKVYETSDLILPVMNKAV